MMLTLNSPITDEQWDAITDVDFEHTDRIWFKTKHGKEVEFVKRKRGRWIRKSNTICYWYECSECGEKPLKTVYGDIARSTFCPWCGADMRDER